VKWIGRIIGLLIAGALGGGIYLTLHRESVTLVTVQGSITELAVNAQGLLWLEGSPQGDSVSLWLLPQPQAAARRLAEGSNLHDLVLNGSEVFYFQEEGNARGRLCRLALPAGPPETLLSDLIYPAGLWVSEAEIYWTETFPREPPVPHVPLLGSWSVLRVMSRTDNSVRTVAYLEATGTRFRGRLLGTYAGQFYWLEQRRPRPGKGISAVKRVPVGRDTPCVVALMPGLQEALLEGERLYWTEPSTELTPALYGAAVYVYRLDAETVSLRTDWLMAGGTLTAHEGLACYGDGIGWWQLPSRLAPARLITEVPTPGRRAQGVLYRGALYIVVRSLANEGSRIVRHPLTWRATLRWLRRRW